MSRSAVARSRTSTGRVGEARARSRVDRHADGAPERRRHQLEHVVVLRRRRLSWCWRRCVASHGPPRGSDRVQRRGEPGFDLLARASRRSRRSCVPHAPPTRARGIAPRDGRCAPPDRLNATFAPKAIDPQTGRTYNRKKDRPVAARDAIATGARLEQSPRSPAGAHPRRRPSRHRVCVTTPRGRARVPVSCDHGS